MTTVYDRDAPINGTEDSPDMLNRKVFAKHLAEILVISPEDDCFTASLEGAWGYGKSSVIKMVKSELMELDKPPIIVEFNPWLIGDAKSLVQKFLIQFAAQLNIPDRPKEVIEVAKELLAYSKLFDVVKLIPGAEPWASTFSKVFGRMGDASSKIGKLKELDLEGRKEKVKHAISKLNHPIVVFIDDIDRLTPDEAFQVIRLSKAVADFQGASFLLAFDHQYLSDALKRYGIENSHQYVEKVVQLRIPLPIVALEDLHIISENLLSELSPSKLTDKFKNDQESLSDLYHRHIKYIVKTPRELKRIFNHLKFVLVQTHGEVCFTDLFVLSVIAIKSPDIYESIKKNPLCYIGEDFGDKVSYEDPQEIVNKYKTHRENLMNQYSEGDRESLQGLLNAIFPLLMENKYFASSGDRDSLGRVSSKNRLYVALHYQVPKSLLSNVDVVSFLSGDIDRASYLKDVIKSEKTVRLFDLLSQNINIVVPNALGIIASILDVFLKSDLLEKEENKTFRFFGNTSLRRIKWLAIDAIDNSENRSYLIFELLKNPNFVVITGEIIFKLMIQHGDVDTDDARLKNSVWLEKDEYIRAREIWKELALQKLEDEAFLKSVQVGHVYYQLERQNPESLKDLFSKWLNNDDGIEKVAYTIGRTGSDSVNGPYTLIDPKEISDYCDVELVKNLAKSELDSNKELPNFLKAVYLSITTGRKYYLNDALEVDDS